MDVSFNLYSYHMWVCMPELSPPLIFSAHLNSSFIHHLLCIIMFGNHGTITHKRHYFKTSAVLILKV